MADQTPARPGSTRKVNLALSALPVVPGTTKEMLASPLRIAPSLDYLEQAFDHVRYGEWSREPSIEFTLPSVRDPSLAPTGAHVLSAYVQWVPNEIGSRESGTGTRPAAELAVPPSASKQRATREPGAKPLDEEGLLRTVIDTLDRHAPGLRGQVVASQLITPAALDRDWTLTGGHIFHGELSLDQAFTMRPLLGFGGYRTPIPACIVRLRHAPRDRAHRRVRRQRRARGRGRVGVSRERGPAVGSRKRQTGTGNRELRAPGRPADGNRAGRKRQGSKDRWSRYSIAPTRSHKWVAPRHCSRIHKPFRKAISNSVNSSAFEPSAIET